MLIAHYLPPQQQRNAAESIRPRFPHEFGMPVCTTYTSSTGPQRALPLKQPCTFLAMNSGPFKNRSVQFIKKNKPKTLPPRRILEKQARKARRGFASCSREFSDFMTCYNKVGATKMSCYTEILKLSRCLDSEQAQGKSHKSTIPFHINRLYKEKK